MTSTTKLLGLPIAAVIVASQPASAQQGGPAAGSKDAAQVSSANRQANADYNHLIGAGDPKGAQPAEKPRLAGKAVPATIADIRAGASLRDIRGVPIGTVATIDADGAVVNTGKTKIRVPLTAFGKDDNGLLLGITATHFNQLVATANSRN
jgi:hypothetical protein